MRSVLILALLLVLESKLTRAQTLSVTPLFGNEGDNLTACVTYTNTPSSLTTIVLSTESGDASGGAISGEDFFPLIESLEFGVGLPLEQCRVIQTLIDQALEPIQDFRVTAVLGSEEIDGSPQTPAINNVPDPLTIGFDQASYSFDEDQANKQACIVIEEGSIEGNLQVTLTLQFTDETAIEGDGDFDSSLLSVVSLQLNRNTPSTGRCFEVPITSDTIVESDETFIMSINPNQDVEFGDANGQATVTIVNDDASCADPPTLTLGSFTLSAGSSPSSRGDTATYTCNESGYMLVGESTLICEVGDIWSPAAPGTCEGLDCGPLGPPANGMVITSGTSFPSGQATYSCDEGYNLAGMGMRDCEADGMWSGEPATCEIVSCDVLPPPNNGQVQQPTVTFMSTATYSCNTGYGLVGDDTRICQANTTWSGEAPTCSQLIACMDLTAPENGAVSPMSGFEGDIATYSCGSGFTLIGDEVRTCEASGWTGVAPVCDEIEVIPPGSLTQEETVGVAVGVSVAGVVILILVIVAIVVLILYMKRRKADKYVLNYSTVYGNQRKTEMTSRSIEPVKENTYQEGGTSSTPQEAEDSLGKPDPEL